MAFLKSKLFHIFQFLFDSAVLFCSSSSLLQHVVLRSEIVSSACQGRGGFPEIHRRAWMSGKSQEFINPKIKE
jgi:hypothetical protein